MDDQHVSSDARADESIVDVDAWLRRHLGRRLTVAFVSAEPLDDSIRRFAGALAGHDEIHVLVPQPGEETGRYLDTLPTADPECVLVAVSPPTTDERQARAILDELERCGILDRALVALIGPHVTREAARRLGFEDGFSAGAEPAKLAAALAREGVAVDERRRRGSSPPCYL